MTFGRVVLSSRGWSQTFPMWSCKWAFQGQVGFALSWCGVAVVGIHSPDDELDFTTQPGVMNQFFSAYD